MAAALTLTDVPSVAPYPTSPLGLHHYYKEHEGSDTISRKFQSSELFTPFLVPQRPTVSASRYRHYRDALEKMPKVPWGTAREYGGEGPINLPEDHRPKSEPPPAVEKGHRHFASGVDPYPRGIPTQQYYDLTQLKRSNIRSNDQLLPRPTQVDMGKIKIDQVFPAEHPYSSHMSRFAMFPSFSQVRDDYKTGTHAQHQRPLHPQIPANPHDITIQHKSKGYAYREEKQHVPHDSEKKALSWPGDNFFQQVKTTTTGKQQFYPIPPKAVLPNHAPRNLDYTLNPRTANALRNVERSQWVTTYSKNFAGYGPSNALNLDNFDEKVDKEQRTGIEDHSLRPRSYPTFMPPRPLEGRISRLVGPNQMVRCVIKDGRIQYVPWSPAIEIEMDKVNDHVNLPSETHDAFQDPLFTKEWLHMQSKQHPDVHLEKIEAKKALEAQDPKNSLPFIPEKEMEKKVKAMAEESYLKKMALRHKTEIEAITERTRWKQAEEQKHHDDLRELKRKVEYTSPALQPNVYYDTLHKIYSTKPPFNYDGDNPYEYDYVTPWNYHKTNVQTESIYNQGRQEEIIREQLKNQINLDPRYVRAYQFAGVPGKNPYVMPKYTQSQLMNERPRLEESVAQKPAAQSSYTYSYSPDKVKTVKTLDTDMYDVKELSKSLPTMFNTKTNDIRKNGLRNGVTISNTAQVATGGGDYPLRVSQTTTASPSDPTKTGNLYDPVGLDQAYNSYVDGRHFNPEGSRDPRYDWFPGSPSGPRPQTKLLKMQNSFTETGTREDFLQTFSEPSPDLRVNINTGKKHDFQGLNACEMH